MTTIILESALAQLFLEAIGPLMKKSWKLLRKLRKAGPQAKRFWGLFKRQYDTLKQTGKALKTRYDLRNVSGSWVKKINDILSEAERLFEDIADKVETVLGRGRGWRVKWTVIYSDCKKAPNKIQQLNVELLNIETAIRLEHEIVQEKTMKKGALVGGVVGGLIGAASGACIADSALKGALVGGFVGAFAGAVIGIGIAWYWC